MMLAAKKDESKDEDVGIVNDNDKGATTSSSSSLTDRQIIDNIKIFLFAGHESTATTIIWVLYLLALHPLVLTKVKEEVRRELPGAPGHGADAEAAFEQLKKLSYLQMVIKETLRLFPPAWAINRSPKEDTVLGGFHIPKGSSPRTHSWPLNLSPASPHL